MNAVNSAANDVARGVVSNSMGRNDSLARGARRYARRPDDRAARLASAERLLTLAPGARADQGARSLARNGSVAISRRSLQPHIPHSLRRRRARDAASSARTGAAESARHGARVSLACGAASRLSARATSLRAL